jgi:eukaryotic-like serine/threonine-protein kinase
MQDGKLPANAENDNTAGSPTESKFDTLAFDTIVPNPGQDDPGEGDPGQDVETAIQFFPKSSRFSFVRKIGRGGQSIVFEAIDSERNSDRVALKALMYRHQRDVNHFKKEFAAIVELGHPHVVRLYDLFCENGQWFFTMELVDGVQLDRWQFANQKDLFGVFLQVTEAINAIHLSGQLHRDIKPQNIMVRQSGSAVLLDLGLVAPWEFPGREHELESIAESDLVGTAEYIAPELWLSEKQTPACDLYSLGITMYRMVTGKVPFPRSRGLVAHFNEKLSCEAPDIREIAKELPDHLAGIINRLLSRRPEDRPSASEVIRVLGGAAKEHITASDSFIRLHGRAPQLDIIRKAYNALLKTDKCVVVSVHGVSGIGKSTFVNQFLLDARNEGAFVASGKCFESSFVPFKAVDGLIDSIRRYLSSSFALFGCLSGQRCQ